MVGYVSVNMPNTNCTWLIASKVRIGTNTSSWLPSQLWEVSCTELPCTKRLTADRSCWLDLPFGHAMRFTLCDIFATRWSSLRANYDESVRQSPTSANADLCRQNGLTHLPKYTVSPEKEHHFRIFIKSHWIPADEAADRQIPPSNLSVKEAQEYFQLVFYLWPNPWRQPLLCLKLRYG